MGTTQQSTMVGAYVRVSTEDQSLDRQLNQIGEFVKSYLDRDVSNLEVYRDMESGKNTDRSGYKELMNDVEDGIIDSVVISEVSRIARDIRDVVNTTEKIAENDASFHVIEESINIEPNKNDPFTKGMLHMSGVFAEMERELTVQRITEGIKARQEAGKHVGRPPLGFNSDDGELVRADNYDEVRTVLKMVDENELSKRAAADEIDSSRSTILRALDRKEMYNL